nr:hypothetical protein [Tanacetum cinerariifolium]
AEPPKLKKNKIKFNSAISSEETTSKKKPTKAKKNVPSKKKTTSKPKPTKKKAPIKANRGKGLNVLSEVALSEAVQLKEATKQRVLDEQHRKTSGAGKGTSTKPGVLDVPKYDSKSDKESWGDSEEEDDDDEYDTEDDEGNDASDGNDNDDNADNDGDDDDNDAYDDDNQEDYDKNDDEEETDKEEEEKVDDEEKMDEDDDDVTKELYKDVNVNLGNEDADMTDVDQGGSGQQNVSHKSRFQKLEEDAHLTLTPVLDTHTTDELVQSSFVSSDFTTKLLNLKNPSLADNEIASLMDTTIRHEEPGSQTLSLCTIPITAVLEITSVFTTTSHLLPPFFNPLPQQATPTPTPTNFEATISFTSLLDFSYYAQALSSIPAIVDHYIDNKLREAIQKAILTHNLDCRQEAQAEKRDYIELVDTSMRAILKEEVNTQLPQILPQAVSDFTTLVIEKNFIESFESVVLVRSSSQPKSTYEADALLSEFELTKILIYKIKKNKSYDKADYKRELYDALVKSYQTDKDLFDTYGEVFTLKRS